MSGGILVAGVGNIFLGDDAFGVEVARRLADDPPAGTQVVDFGIRAIQLAYQLLDGYDTLILVDALARGETPGTLYVFEPDPTAPASVALDAHGLDPAAVLALVRTLGGTVGRTILVGCEPGEMSERLGLSAAVELAVDDAVRLVRRLVADHQNRPATSREEETSC